MRFLAPGFLHLAWLLVIPVALYLYRREAKRQLVSTLLFFRVLAREHQESAWLRQLKRWLSLLLTLLMWLLIVLTLGRPIWSGGERVGALVIVVDRSASMGATDAQGVTRLEVAKERLQQMLSQVPETVAVSVVAFDARSEVVVSRSQNRRECLRALDALTVRPMEAVPEAGGKLGRRLAAVEPNSGVWWVSDDCGAAAVHLKGAENVGLRMVDVSLSRGLNVGITAFQVRPLPMERQRSEGFLQVTAAEANSGSVTVRLEASLDGRLAQLREFEMAPGQQSALTLPFEGAVGQLLEVRVIAEGDCLGWDDVVLARLPAQGALKVAWYAQDADPFTELAFQSLVDGGRIEMWRGDVENFPPSDLPDVFVFENWLPKEWVGDRPVIALRPPSSLGPVQVRGVEGGGVPHPNVRVPQPTHPVVFRAAMSRVALTQTGEIDLGLGLEGLWMVGSDAVLAAGEVDGQRLVIGAFHPARSEQLALLPTFPLVLGNALLWCAADSPAQRGLNVVRTGQVVEQQGLVDWTFWDGDQVRSEAQQNTGWTQITRLGTWEGQNGATGGVSLLASLRETQIVFGQNEAANEATMNEPQEVIQGRTFAAPTFFLLLLLGLLLLESYLFHRHAVY